MAKTIDYFLSASSPWTYLGHPRLAALAQMYGAHVNLRPVDFGRIFAVSGGLPLKDRPPQRRAYRVWELKRWKSYLNDPINLEPKFFPIAADRAGRLVIAAEPHGTDAQMRIAYAAMRAVFVEDRNITDRDTLVSIAEATGFGAALVEASEASAVQGKFDAYTQEAIERQVFGAPTYIIDGEPFWGQDRLEFVERALQRA